MGSGFLVDGREDKTEEVFEAMKILFIGMPDSRYPWYEDFVASLGSAHSVEIYQPDKPVVEQFKGVKVVVELGVKTEGKMIDIAVEEGVKLWQALSVGVNHIEVAYFLAKGLPLANTPGPFSAPALAEHALFLMLCLAKKLTASLKNIRSNVVFRPITEELQGKTLGIVGLGASGRALAKRANSMGMRIVAIDLADVPQAMREEFQLSFFGGPSQLDLVLAQADYLSLHMPLTRETQHMIDARAFQQMKSTAALINVSRGEIVDEKALTEALESGQIWGAGLDVFAQEPLDPEHPLLKMDNVIATPHVAGGTRETSQRRAQAAAENVDRIAEGLPALYQITSAE